MRYCFFGKSVLFIQERKRNRFGVVCLFKYFGHLGGWGVDPRRSRITAASFERNPQPETPPFLCPRAPRPPSAAALSGRPSRRVWAVGCVGASRWRLGHSPCPATHTRTHTHCYTHTRSTSATHTPAPAAFFTHPLAHLTLHTSLLTARRGACLADQVLTLPSGRRGLRGRMLCPDLPPHLLRPYRPPRLEPTLSGGASCPHPSPTPQHAHLEESSWFPSPRATSVSSARS